MYPAKQRFAFGIVKSALRSPRVKRSLPPTDARVTSAYVSVIGVGSRVQSPCVTLTVLRGVARSYFFNFTKTTTPNNIGIGADLRGVFYTRLSWGSVAECVRMLLVNRVITKPFEREAITILGPPDTQSFVDRLFSFIMSKKINNKLKRILRFSNHHFYEDENIQIKQVCLRPGNQETVQDANLGTTAAYICTLQRKNKCDNHSTKPSDAEMDDIDRKLDSIFLHPTVDTRNSPNDSAPEHPSSEVSCREIIHANQSPTIFVLDCPSMCHFECVESDEIIMNHFSEVDRSAPCLVIHMTPPPVYVSKRYQTWMLKLGRCCNHIVLNDDSKGHYNLEEVIHHLALHNASAEFFPPVNENLLTKRFFMPSDVIQATPGLSYQLQCEHDGTWTNEVVYGFKASGDSPMSSMMRRYKSMTGSKVIESTSAANPDENLYPVLTVLGSGCAVSTPSRAQPSFLLRLSKENSILLDCGAQTLQRMFHNFGRSYESALASIKVVFLSHKHLDHHAGFLPMLENILKARTARPDLKQEKVFCLMPRSMSDFYRDYCEDFMPWAQEHTVFIELESVRSKVPEALQLVSNLADRLNIMSFWPIFVNHSEKTYGVAIRMLSGQKVVYSSDTRPMCPNLVYEGQGADLLIHDCLYIPDGLKDEAWVLKHSTLSGALATAEAMEAKFVLLCHFSRLYPTVPVLSSEIPAKWTGRVACLHDLLNVSLSKVSELPKLDATLSTVFEDSRQRYTSRATRLEVDVSKRKKDLEKLTMLI